MLDAAESYRWSIGKVEEKISEMNRKNVAFCLLIAAICMTLSACSSKEADDTGKSEEAQTVIDSTDKETKRSTSSGFPKVIPEFSTIDLQGNVVANDVFSKTDLTVVNFWATYCSPCISELPELGEWAEEMPDNVQIIGIVVDVESEESDQYALACQLAEQTGAGYQNLVAVGEFDDIIYELIGVPTTFFVDKDGNIVGDPIVGADVDGYKTFVEEYMNE